MLDDTNDGPDRTGTIGHAPRPYGGFSPMKPAAVQNTTLAERTYDLLRQALLNGDFLPGQSISLRSAAQALGVSQMPVRQALSRLQTEGILVMHENRTLTVPRVTATWLVEHRDVRIALEGHAAELASRNVSRVEVGELRNVYAAMQRAVRDGDVRAYISANLGFHMGVYRASRSGLLFGLIESLWMKFTAYTRLSSVEDAVGTLDNHARALRAMERRDGVLARSAIVQDCCDTCEIQLRILHEQTARGNNAPAVGSSAEAAPPAGSLGSLVGPKRRGRPPRHAAPAAQQEAGPQAN